MALAKMTLMEMHNFNSHLFDAISLPEGLDNDTLINTILLECGEFEPLYASPTFMQQAISVWFDKWKHTITKWNDAMNLKYDPIYNYDRFEEYTDKETGKSHNSGQDNAVREDKKSAYDSNSYEPYASSTEGGTTSADMEHEGSTEHKAHLYGNIGVTTSQQMLQAEYDIAKWNIYNNIMDLFKTELVLTIY